MGGYPLWEGALEVLLYTTSNLQIQGTLSDLILIFWQWSEQVAKYYQLCVIISHVVYVDSIGTCPYSGTMTYCLVCPLLRVVPLYTANNYNNNTWI